MATEIASPSAGLVGTSSVPTLSELNSMLDHVRQLEAQLTTSLEHMNKALKKMMKRGQWRKEWNRAASGKDALPKSEQRMLQVDLISKIQSVRQEMSCVRREWACPLCRRPPALPLNTYSPAFPPLPRAESPRE